MTEMNVANLLGPSEEYALQQMKVLRENLNMQILLSQRLKRALFELKAALQSPEDIESDLELGVLKIESFRRNMITVSSNLNWGLSMLKNVINDPSPYIQLSEAEEEDE